MKRSPAIHHCTSQPFRFFGRAAELAMLDQALAGGEPSVVAMIGPGGQGKTAIAQHWLASRERKRPECCDGIFLWSFYRAKDCELCLREMLAYADGLDKPPDVSASYCVDRLLQTLRSERWALVLDGTEVVQHEQGAWLGRFMHPELGRLLEELASSAMPGVVVLTSRFPMPTLAHRTHARILSLSTLDDASGAALLESLGVIAPIAVLLDAARACGLHAKAVELLGTYLVRYQQGQGDRYRALPAISIDGASDEEIHVTRVLQALQSAMPAELQDILALATSFRQPTTEAFLYGYLRSEALRHLLHDTWGRRYEPFIDRPLDWLKSQVQALVDLRLLERVDMGRSDGQVDGRMVLDAHPLVRGGFEHVLGPAQQGAEFSESCNHDRSLTAVSRAGFLRGRPGRQTPQSLEDAREEVELFHAYADAGLWNEADSTFVALANPKHRFLAPAFERDLLLRFFPGGDRRQRPLWTGFGRHRSLAICFEMLGQFEDAIDAYRAVDAPLRGDALLALGRLQPFLDMPDAAHPWQTLWQAYRAHAMCLLGRTDEAFRLAQSIIATDVYEWVHLFECLLRLGKLDTLDLGCLLYRPPLADEHRWAQLARERMRLDYLRISGDRTLGNAYRQVIDEYDRGGLPYERVLSRLGYTTFLLSINESAEAHAVNKVSLELARRFAMKLLEFDALELSGENSTAHFRFREQWHYSGPSRP